MLRPLRIPGRRLVKLRCQPVIAADGALHKLREPRDKEQEPDGIFFRLIFSVIDIDQIARGLEHIEGKTERHEKPRHPREIPSVFKQTEHAEV